MASEELKNQARGRLDRIGTVFYGDRSPALVVERVIADYALVGGPPLKEIMTRAQARVRKMSE